MVAVLSCAGGIGEAVGQVFSCGLVEASEMFLSGAQGVLGRYCVFPPWLVWDGLAVSSCFMGATGMSVLPTNKCGREAFLV